ncbi:hemin uptake protein HemP [Luteimonas cucumeris]|uniref:Hemin uptake protein HemP n=1 Tax=Luteimonas cucumeris TaxID=985012 RepID=A0A562LFA6_9GAMM|nr:hemin uptake protein HemP [Luteimonas cucumeris]TWI06298.1 hemin uptake protein HemP [Luteimonas cucumeris]
MPTLSSPPFRVVQTPQGSIVATPLPAAGEIDSDCLLQGQREILIRHGSECYRLRHTRNDKLILTK